ncbi:MAG: FHA domain-containing protein [Eubacterium sp.]|nr:FHA domain-containing protein [Eubacterium sp.]
MNLKRCPNNHFYDADKFATCPHCSGDNSGDYFDDGGDTTAGYTSADSYTAGPTDRTAGYPEDEDTYRPTGPTRGDDFSDIIDKTMGGDRTSGNTRGRRDPEDGDKTVRAGESTSSTGKPYVVGWLVTIDGTNKGRSYEVVSGKNFIGRGSEMDIKIEGDKSVSRDKHAVILYEPNERVFLVQSGDTRELSYLNGKVILSAERLEAYDRISIGHTNLLFVPFCGEKFSWDEMGE